MTNSKRVLPNESFARNVARAGYYGVKKLLSLVSYRTAFDEFSALSKNTKPRFALDWSDRLACLSDRSAVTPFDAHYTYHPAWAARILAQTMPAEHVDISSLLAFSTIISAFIPVRFYDYRPAQLTLRNLTSEPADLTELPFDSESLSSLSCMHTVEHIGLGRYGDPIDPDGDLKAVGELNRVLANGANFLFVVPVGQPRIQFNAHRIYSYDQVVTSLFGRLRLKEFTLVTDQQHGSRFIQSATREESDAQAYGCGCFWFEKA